MQRRRRSLWVFTCSSASTASPSCLKADFNQCICADLYRFIYNKCDLILFFLSSIDFSVFSFRRLCGFRLVLWRLWCLATFFTPTSLFVKQQHFQIFENSHLLTLKIWAHLKSVTKSVFSDAPFQRGHRSEKTWFVFWLQHRPPSYLSPKSFHLCVFCVFCPMISVTKCPLCVERAIMKCAPEAEEFLSSQRANRKCSSGASPLVSSMQLSFSLCEAKWKLYKRTPGTSWYSSFFVFLKVWRKYTSVCFLCVFWNAF